jgi:hypothetical protein
VNWKLGIALVQSFTFVATLVSGSHTYFLQEAVLVLLLVAAGVIVVLLIFVALVLIREGARLGFVWLKAKAAGTTSMSGGHVGPVEAMSERPLK